MKRCTFIIPVLIAFAVSACSDTKTNMNTESFWPWFEAHSDQFADLFSYETQSASRDDDSLRQKTKNTVKEVGDKLRETNPEFSPFFGFADGSNEMMVTVHGQAEHFNAVDEFISSAPSIDGWKFVALKQPLELGPETEIRSGEAKLKVGDFRYTKTKMNGGSFDFSIYAPAKVSDDPEGYLNLFKRLTMDFLGERFASMAVGEVTVHELTADSPADLLPFVDIHADVNRAINGG